MKTGHYHNLDIDEYHADPAVGSSKLIDFMVVPAYYKAVHLDKSVNKSSPSMQLGKLAHMLLLEPEEFADKCYILEDGLNKRTKAYRNLKDEIAIANKIPVSYEEYKQLCNMVEAVKAHPYASLALSNGKAEQSFFCKDEESGLMIKARPDYLICPPEIRDNEGKVIEGGLMLVDYKTTSVSLDLRIQSYHAKDYSRHIQAAHHRYVVEKVLEDDKSLMGLLFGEEKKDYEPKIQNCLYVVQSTQAPYLVRVIKMPLGTVMDGEVSVRNSLKDLAICMQVNEWPGYDYNDLSEYQYWV